MNIENFLNDLVKELGLEKLDADTLGRVKESLMHRIETRLIADIRNNLTPEQIKEADEKMTAGENPMEIMYYFVNKIPNLPMVLQNSLDDERKNIINDMNRIDENIEQS